MTAPVTVHRGGPQDDGQGAGARRGAPKRLELLLGIEGRLRQLPSVRAVEIFTVNETRALLGYSQAFFMRLDSRGRAKTHAVSGLAVVERNAPHVRAMERLAGRMNAAMEAGADFIHGPMGRFMENAEEGAQTPFGQVLWLVLRDRKGVAFGGLLLTRAEPWEDKDALIGQRLAGAVSHALMALSPPSLLRRFAPPRWLLIGLPVLALLMLFIPVPMTAIAPVEVVAADPVIVAAPMQGVIADVLKRPNEKVRAGEILFVYDDTELKAQRDVAARREAVARARLETLRKAAFHDPKARRQLAEAEAELALAQTERAHADRLLKLVRVRSPADGIAVYPDRSEWIRKPVKTGVQVMQIADPQRMALRIDLPVRDAIAIRPGGRVRVFLDADPLHVIGGRVRTASFHAGEIPGGLLAYRVMADFAGDPQLGKAVRVRIGFRGSAQLIGEKVPLAFYLFRRPVSAVRQYLGI